MIISSEYQQHKNIQISEQGWLGITSIAEQFGWSVSELLENLGQGKLLVIQSEAIENYMDLVEAETIISEAKTNEEIPTNWADFEAELGL
jgi:hypothetical protein